MKRCILFLVAMTATGLAQAVDGPSFGIGVDYSTGDYGSDIDTEILLVPLSARLQAGNWTLNASVPWLQVSGDPNVLPTVGTVENLNPTGRGRGGLIGGPTEPESTERGSASGIGDLSLGAVYSFPTDSALGVALGVNAKIATADEDKGLGTGANDYGVNLDLYRDFDGTMLFGGVGNVRMGDSTFIDVGSVQTANLGISQAVGDSARLGAMYDHRTAAASGLEDRRDLIGFYSVPTSGGGRFQLYASSGLSDGSPDWGAGIAIRSGF